MSLPTDLPPANQDEIRRRQRSRAIVTGLLLAAMVILFYGVSIAKMLK